MLHDHNIINNTDRREQYRPYVADLNMSVQEADALIEIVQLILAYFVERAFGGQTDQLTVDSDAEVFDAPRGYDSIEHCPEYRTAISPSNGVERDSNPQGSNEP